MAQTEEAIYGSRVRDCPICGSAAHRLWFEMDREHVQSHWRVEDEYLARQEFGPDHTIRIVRCRDCGMLYNRTHSDWACRDAVHRAAEPQPEKAQPEKTRADFHIDGAQAATRLAAWVLEVAMRRKGGFYFRQAGLRILDFSCGSGGSLRVFWACGVEDLHGFDLGRPPSLDVPGLTFHDDLQELRRQAPFDLLVNIAALEHYDRPREMLETMRDLLSPRGLLVAAAPTVPYAQLDRFRETGLREEGFARGYFHPWHINHYSVGHLARLIESAGLRILPITGVHPRKSYYVDWDAPATAGRAVLHALMTLARCAISPIAYRSRRRPWGWWRLFHSGWFFCERA